MRDRPDIPTLSLSLSTEPNSRGNLAHQMVKNFSSSHSCQVENLSEIDTCSQSLMNDYWNLGESESAMSETAVQTFSPTSMEQVQDQLSFVLQGLVLIWLPM